MNVARKILFVGSAAAVALLCCAGSVGTFDWQSGIDQMAQRMTYSLAQWQPASGYVPAAYPTDGSWERMVALNAR